MSLWDSVFGNSTQSAPSAGTAGSGYSAQNQLANTPGLQNAQDQLANTPWQNAQYASPNIRPLHPSDWLREQIRAVLMEELRKGTLQELLVKMVGGDADEGAP